MQGKTILTVDDTISNLDILSELLQDYDVIGATNGLDALEIVDEEEIDLILLDIMMPEMDGYEVCQKLKLNPKTKNIPIIFITAKTDEDSIEKAYDIGGADYVTKPFKVKELLARIKTQLRIDSLITSVKDRTKKVKTLLDHANQGFLSFDKDFLIEDSYSNKCLEIFELDNIAKLNISDLLFENSINKKDLFIEGINNILESDNQYNKELFLSLLPKEQIINNKTLTIEYKILSNEMLMCIVTDITDTIKLELELKEKQKIQDTIVAIVINKKEFLQLKLDFEYFISNPPLSLEKLLRELHTYKGIFLQKEMHTFGNHLHNLESKINDLILVKSNFSQIIEEFNKFNLKNLFENELNSITSLLGKDFLNTKSTLNIDENSLNNIEEKINSLIISDSDKDTILSDFYKLKYTSLNELLISNILHVKKQAVKLNKEIHPLEIEFSKDVLVPPKLGHFINSLIHLFNNCVEHGIENIEQRIEKQKDEIGTIECLFEEKNNNLIIKISDDGGGINIEKIINQTVKKRILTIEEINELNQKQKLELIFLDNISSKENVSISSGRGIGMSAIKQNLSEVDGTVEIKNHFPNNGAEFIFTIPLKEKEEEPKNLNHKLFLNLLTIQIKKFITDISTLTMIDEQYKENNSYDIYDNNSKIELYGIDNYELIFSYDEILVEEVSTNMIPTGFNEEETEEMLEELPIEIINTVIGLAISNLPRLQQHIDISIPTKIEKNEIVENGDLLLVKKMKFNRGNVLIMLYKKEKIC